MGSREAGGVVLALLGIAALLMAVNGTMGKVWADITGQKAPIGSNGPDAPGTLPPNGGATGGIPQTFAPGPSPAQPPPDPFEVLTGFPGSGVRTNA